MNNATALPAAMLAFVSFLFLMAVWLGGPPVGEAIAREDQFIEYLTALLFFLGAVACAYALLKGRHRGWAAFWLVLCFLCMGEEVSWFQRVFGYSVPAIEQNSAQAEFNLHNMTIFGHGRIMGDGSVKLTLSALLNSQNLFRLGFLAWFAALPVLTLVPLLARLAARLDYVRPAAALLVPMWLVIVVAAGLTLSTAPPIKDYVAEATELAYASMIFVYTLQLAASAATVSASAIRRALRTGAGELRQA